MRKRIIQQIHNAVTGKRGVAFYLIAASILMSIAMLVTYTRTGVSTFTPTLSGRVLTLMGLCVALSAGMTVVEIKVGKFALYLLELWTWLEFLLYEASYISNVLVGIDGNLFSAGFLLTAGFGLLAWALALASAICQQSEIGSQRQRTVWVECGRAEE